MNLFQKIILAILAIFGLQQIPIAPPTPIPTPAPILLPVEAPQPKPISIPSPTPAPVLVMPAPVPIPVPQPTPQPLPSLLPATKTLEEKSIDLRSVVVLRCQFIGREFKQVKEFYGSGVIVDPSGIILTARHLVDQKYTYDVTGGNQGELNYDLESCNVGWPEQNVKTPTSQDIRAINPFTPVNNLHYTAKIYFLPKTDDFSETEDTLFDMALLKIEGVDPDAQQYFGVQLPKEFIYSSVLTSTPPPANDEIVTFGFPSGAPAYGTNFFLQGSVGQVKRIINGDKKFANMPIEIESLMETISGRSGSPVFWRGYVVGIVSFKQDFSINAFNASTVPLGKLLKENNINLVN